MPFTLWHTVTDNNFCCSHCWLIIYRAQEESFYVNAQLFVVCVLRNVPHFGPQLQAPFREYLEKQKKKLHHKPGQGESTSVSVRRILLEFVVTVSDVDCSLTQTQNYRVGCVFC